MHKDAYAQQSPCLGAGPREGGNLEKNKKVAAHANSQSANNLLRRSRLRHHEFNNSAVKPSTGNQSQVETKRAN